MTRNLGTLGTVIDGVVNSFPPDSPIQIHNISAKVHADPVVNDWVRLSKRLGINGLNALVSDQIRGRLKATGYVASPINPNDEGSACNWFRLSFVDLRTMERIIAYREVGIAKDKGELKKLRQLYAKMQATGRADVRVSDVA